MVCAGFTQGLELLCEVLRARGAVTIAAEAYGHPRHRHIAEVSADRGSHRCLSTQAAR